MRHIEELLEISAKRKGGADAVLSSAQPVKSAAELAAVPDDRWLAEMTRSIFQAGFSWKTVNTMWPGFEEAFQGFDPGWCSHIADERFDSLIGNRKIVRHGTKIMSVAENARFVGGKDGFGAWVAGFGSARYSELLLCLKAEGARLGGATGQYFLRTMGVESWILSRDVSARLVAEGVVDSVTMSKGNLKRIQEAFDEWQAQSDFSLNQISRILATSIGD